MHWKEPVEGLFSQIRTVLSPLHEASTAGTPSTPVEGFQATLHTLSVWPSSLWISLSSKLSPSKLILRNSIRPKVRSKTELNYLEAGRWKSEDDHRYASRAAASSERKCVELESSQHMKIEIYMWPANESASTAPQVGVSDTLLLRFFFSLPPTNTIAAGRGESAKQK